MKYDKLRGSSIAEMMMQLRSQYGQSVYIIQTREIKQGGLFGSDLLAKKQYEIEYMVSEGDAPYGKAKPQRPVARLPERRSVLDRPPTSLPSVDAKPITPPEREGARAANAGLETNLNDLDALIESLKALKTRSVEEKKPSVANQASSQMPPSRSIASHSALSESSSPSVAYTTPSESGQPPAYPSVQPQKVVAAVQAEPTSMADLVPEIFEMPTREELEALFRVDADDSSASLARLASEARDTAQSSRAAGPSHAGSYSKGFHTGDALDPREETPLSRIRNRLLENQGSLQFVDRFLQKLERSLSEEDRLHPNRVRSRSVEKMKDMIRVLPTLEREHGERKVVFFVGPNGSGKTTSLAKLAYRYQVEEGLGMSMYSLDLHRVAATEQLKTYAAVLQVPFFSPLFESDFREYLDRDGSQLIFVDTSGMGLRNADRRDELVRFIECVKDSVEVHLVLPVSISPSLTEKYMEFFEPTGFEKILLTRLDEADFLANFVEAADKWKRPFSFLNNSPEVSSPLMSAGPEDLARMVLGLSS